MSLCPGDPQDRPDGDADQDQEHRDPEDRPAGPEPMMACIEPVIEPLLWWHRNHLLSEGRSSRTSGDSGPSEPGIHLRTDCAVAPDIPRDQTPPTVSRP